MLEISGSHGDENVYCDILNCDAMESCTSLPMFWETYHLHL